MTVEECVRHIEHKMAVRELGALVGGRMLAALDGGAPPDYQTLLAAAQYPPPGRYVYHTAPTSARDLIERFGMRAAYPEEGHWGDKAAGQPRGIYVGSEPDERGVWAFHYDEWDVWRIDMSHLPWWPDLLNPGSYRLAAVWPDRLSLHGSFSR